MRYYFKINDTEFNASQLQIKSVYRNENIQTNLLGDLLIDRAGTEKLKVSVQFNLLTEDQMSALRNAYENVTCTAVFDRGNTRLQKQMRIPDFTEPSPVYPYGDKSNGIIYPSIVIDLEEI